MKNYPKSRADLPDECYHHIVCQRCYGYGGKKQDSHLRSIEQGRVEARSNSRKLSLISCGRCDECFSFRFTNCPEYTLG